MTKTLKNKKGTSLVELLAVIVIMGIIAAIAVPAVGTLITNQQRNADRASANQVLDSAKSTLIQRAGSGSADRDVTAAELLTAESITAVNFKVSGESDAEDATVTFTLGANNVVTVTIGDGTSTNVWWGSTDLHFSDETDVFELGSAE